MGLIKLKTLQMIFPKISCQISHPLNKKKKSTTLKKETKPETPPHIKPL